MKEHHLVGKRDAFEHDLFERAFPDCFRIVGQHPCDRKLRPLRFQSRRNEDPRIGKTVEPLGDEEMMEPVGRDERRHGTD